MSPSSLGQKRRQAHQLVRVWEDALRAPYVHCYSLGPTGDQPRKHRQHPSVYLYAFLRCCKLILASQRPR